ncbi:bifunctional methylenetetrahydrofolate dehydrogenase/methenyltetrahydrofolate cyclohydrolase FolD [Lichenicola cladoniae]|uniref:Bifunctional protein FolD n=1 Tax=Lichenicola cladoniae TaxID=1484109 RepID=A0A6M8HEU9_9PROT|nr:bifunctional methylenetetrahydrofolate dehydrogenase/methenyltetrahydrofolate cyclohydrolase FolD [Acetobacteraceae bacterium]QKE88910.1 bifunctional methylenetetrahydrofolate dehydrogenase/methenyltetrahydrofolate cyclohydrolase FolD [Lichenicola cladoniae]
MTRSNIIPVPAIPMQAGQIQTRLIDGKAHAARLTAEIELEVAQLAEKHGIVPGLAVVLVGNNPASEVYVRSKIAHTEQVGMRSIAHILPGSTTQQELLSLVADLNADPTIHGVLVQLPLPRGIDAALITSAIDPAKDVDGLGPMNVGLTTLGLPGLVPCTPLGCLLLLRGELGSLKGLHAVVVGKSNLVGRPMAQLLLQEECTVTVCHVATADVGALACLADILVVATGHKGLVRREWIKPGATVIDVGINRVTTPEGRTRLVGDVVFDEAMGRAGRLTPVPGGVGPMTIACLLRNTLTAAQRSLR